MQKQYLTCREAPPVPPYDAAQMAQGLGVQLASFLFPLLVQLDAVLDKRLVRTFLATIQVIITFRDRANGLLLSELGGYLEMPVEAPSRDRHSWRLCAGGVRAGDRLPSSVMKRPSCCLPVRRSGGGGWCTSLTRALPVASGWACWWPWACASCCGGARTISSSMP